MNRRDMLKLSSYAVAAASSSTLAEAAVAETASRPSIARWDHIETQSSRAIDRESLHRRHSDRDLPLPASLAHRRWLLRRRRLLQDPLHARRTGRLDLDHCQQHSRPQRPIRILSVRRARGRQPRSGLGSRRLSISAMPTARPSSSAAPPATPGPSRLRKPSARPSRRSPPRPSTRCACASFPSGISTTAKSRPCIRSRAAAK